MSEITHMCPPGDESLMPCCGRSPFEVMSDRMTLDPKLVTCTGPTETMPTALEFIDMTMSANELTASTWRNDEVLEMLRLLRELVIAGTETW